MVQPMLSQPQRLLCAAPGAHQHRPAAGRQSRLHVADCVPHQIRPDQVEVQVLRGSSIPWLKFMQVWYLAFFGIAVVALMIWLPGGLLSIRERLDRKGGPQ